MLGERNNQIQTNTSEPRSILPARRPGLADGRGWKNREKKMIRKAGRRPKFLLRRWKV